MTASIHIDRVRLYARIGVMPQERAVGGEFLVSMEAEVEADEEAVDADRLEGTVDYARLTALMREEAARGGRLLETVAKRMADRVAAEFPRVARVSVTIEKENPPLGVFCQGVSVKITRAR